MKPDFESYMCQIMEWNDGGDDVGEYISKLPPENIIDYANRYAEHYQEVK